MAERLRCAVIGLGAIGSAQLTNFLHCPRATVVAVAENNANRAKELADRYKISRSFTNYRDILDQPDIEAVSIALPNHLHAKVAVEALQSRKHVLLEKPMAMNAREAAKIIETAKKMKRMLMVSQNFRFYRHTQMARQIIERGDLGEIYHARCFWLRRKGIPRIGSWFTQKQYAGGGSINDLGSHLLDTCLHLMGEFNVTSVTATTHARFGPRGVGEMDWGKSEIDAKKPFDVEDHGVVLLKTKSGRSIILEASWAGDHPGDHREYGIDLLGTKAGLALYPARMYRECPDGYESVDLSLPTVPHAEDRIHHFVDCILDRRKPIVTMEESLKLQQIMDAIYRSSERGEAVTVR
jgi:predicted dehydrogenase